MSNSFQGRKSDNSSAEPSHYCGYIGLLQVVRVERDIPLLVEPSVSSSCRMVSVHPLQSILQTKAAYSLCNRNNQPCGGRAKTI